MAILNGINIKGTEEVHQLDYNKAIANKPLLVKSFNDLEGKPFYTEVNKYIIFEEQDVQFVAMSEGGLQGYGYIHNPPIGINGNLDCIVEWDGVGYRCTPMVESDTEESKEIYVGNLGFLGGEDTGEPFLILDNLQMTVFATIAEGTHKVCVHQSDEVVHQLEPKYVNAFTKEETLMLLNSLVNGDEVAY